MKHLWILTLCASVIALSGCEQDDALDNENASFPIGKADGTIEENSPEAHAVLELVNDDSIPVEELDDEARLHSRAAQNIVAERPFQSLADLDAVPFVGPIALSRLLDYAIEKGLLGGESNISVIFSPQELEQSHTAAIAEWIDSAEVSIDIAMYSYSSSAIGEALERATDRGLPVRFVFETAKTRDRNLEGDALQNSKSGQLENAGVDVRYVNKTMHHKFIIIDGPRDDVARASSSKVATGSANWSTGGATIFDEDTLFIENNRELSLRYQKEFNLMWEHSRDFEAQEFVFDQSAATILEEDIPQDFNLDVFFTSDNFSVNEDSTTFRTDRSLMTVADTLIQAIEDAEESIGIASGHFRLRPVADALIAKKLANPSFDVRVYVDQQEYLSPEDDAAQIARRVSCLDEAESEREFFDCNQKSFLHAKRLGEAGIQVLYKAYSYRWHFSFAKQMHHKFMIVDGDELFAGSYNLSINAEHSTFENVVHLQGASYQGVIQRYVEHFDELITTGIDGIENLREDIETMDSIPLVFDAMALSWQELTNLKLLIVEQCPDVLSDEFIDDPGAHRDCPR